MLFRDKATGKIRTEVIDTGSGKPLSVSPSGNARTGLINAYVSQLQNGQIFLDQLDSLVEDDALRNEVIQTYSDIVSPQPTNKLWVNRMISFGKLSGDSDQVIRNDLKSSFGVPDSVLNSVLPNTESNLFSPINTQDRSTSATLDAIFNKINELSPDFGSQRLLKNLIDFSK